MLSEDGDGPVDDLSNSDWDKAIHYHEIKRRLDEVRREKVRAAVIRAIVRRAQAAVGSVAKPYELKSSPWEQHPQDEFDLDATLEEDPTLEHLQVERKEPRRAEVIVCLDTSLSMTGRKLALTAVALAVLALQLEPEDFAVIAFESDAALIKGLGEDHDVYEVLKRFMEVPARGLTNIEAGLLMAQAQAAKGKLSKKAVILMTDGRHTAGRNPEYLATRLPRLHVVQTGNPWASPRFCRTLARKGRGKYLRVAKLEHLPAALYSLVQEIIR
ncbi:MAG: VWA domain-containing protein [Proteobacteria bacterium]|nr:MAG: VWA domain-containing protein [Pseudomonadota bacterium]